MEREVPPNSTVIGNYPVKFKFGNVPSDVGFVPFMIFFNYHNQHFMAEITLLNCSIGMSICLHKPHTDEDEYDSF